MGLGLSGVCRHLFRKSPLQYPGPHKVWVSHPRVSLSGSQLEVRIFVALGRHRVPLGTKFTLSYGLGLIPFDPNLIPSREKVNNRNHLSQKGFCWKFHKGIACTGCSYKHQCFRCGNSHPISKCQQASKQQAGNTGPKTTSFTSQGTLNRTPSIRSPPNSSQS